MQSNDKLLENKAIPFVHIYESIKRHKEYIMEDGDIGICMLNPVSLHATYEEILNFLRNGNTNYIYIENMDSELKGLFCTDTDRILADTDSCFFVGEYFENNHKIKIVLSAEQLRDNFNNSNIYYVAEPRLVEKSIVTELYMQKLFSLISCQNGEH